MLGEYLGASRVHYSELSADGEYVHIRADYCDGVASVVGRHRLDDHGPTVVNEFRQGRILVVSNVQGDPRLSEAERAATARLGIDAYIVVPLIKQGRPRGLLVVHHATARAWTGDEVALVDEVAERTWFAVERARTVGELRRAYSLIEGITEGTEDLIAAMDLDYCYTYFNQPYWREFKKLWSHEIEVGTCMVDVMAPWPDEQRKARELWSRALGGESFRVEMEFGPSAEEMHVYDLRFSPLRDGRGQVVGAAHILRDVTERVSVQQALRQSEERLRELDRRKDEYLAMLGHELRNPLAAIQSATELVTLQSADEPRLQRVAGVLERQSSHMARLIEGLLEVSRIAQGKIDLERDTLDVRDLVAAVLEDRGAQFSARGLVLEHARCAEPLWVHGDRVRLAQVVDNLLGNALKFTPPPGTITVVVARDDGHAVIRVGDTGVGIRPENLSRIFEPFHQEQQDVARGGGGLGLGLALSWGLVELHQGTIEARSAGLGAGAEFEVRLPLAAGPPRAEVAQRVTVGRALRILLVEDNSDAAEMLVDLLVLQGHDVALASTGAEALDILRRDRKDVVLCDIGLPGMNGYDVARAIRADAALRDTSLVALTGYGQPEDRQRTAEVGFDMHLTKPVEQAELGAVLARLAVASAGLDR